MTLIRYPGSKDMHLKHILPLIEDRLGDSPLLVEPFAGTAALTFHLLKRGKISGYWINDLDQSIVALWWAVKNKSKELADLVSAYQPRAEDFYRLKNDPHDYVDNLTKAFNTIVLHQISYSGLGVKAGSPIGGRKQLGSYKVDARWNGERIASKILELSELLKSVPGNITGASWEVPLEFSLWSKLSFFYIDPPYFEVGPQLYEYGTIDHFKLARDIQRLRHPWALSYNTHETILELYRDQRVIPLQVKSQLNSRDSGDLLIVES